MIVPLLRKALLDYEASSQTLPLLEAINNIEKLLIENLKIANSKTMVASIPTIEPKSTRSVTHIKPLILQKENIVSIPSQLESIIEETLKHKSIAEVEIKSNDKIGEKISVNETMEKKLQHDVNNFLENVSIKNISNNIDFNTKFLFIQEIFQHNETSYQTTITALDNADNIENAMAYLHDQVIIKYSLDANNEHLELLSQFIRRRFL